MKKLIAILLSVLMLCSVIPFAAVSVSADDDHYIEIVADAEEVNAGDEVSIEVSLYGHEDLGIIGLLLELDFDNDVFELETYYDEDEELWMPPIEVGPKFSASSNKYIMFSPIDEETGYMERCLVKFDRALASATQAVKTNLYFTVTFKVKDDAVSGDYTIGLANFVNKSVVMYGLTVADWSWEPITIHVNGTEPEVPTCKHEYDNACDVDCNLCYEPREVEHSVQHAAAVEPTCTTEGNIEYWYCEVCGMAWLNAECTQNTNLKAVKLPMGEHQYLYACDQYCNECGEKTNPGAKHSVLHVEAKEAVNCIELGNKEYWYCEHCYTAWLDANLIRQTNMQSVKIAGECESDATYACQDGVCIHCTLPVAAEADHEYTNAHDASCNVCGAVRELVLSADEIILFGGNSVSETKSGLAFKFDVAVNGVVFNEEYYADYTNATVTIDGVEYKLVGLGAIANNKDLKDQTLDDIDGHYVLDVFANKVFEDSNGATSYAIRVVNIPAEHLDSEIIVRPYFIYEADGAEIVVYGQDAIQSYNGAL
ncbi:MAG: hypothetical protein IKA50_06415 [Clostridia bacterium]|nr:hypothetical protein [Clostridia bacterium]